MRRCDQTLRCMTYAIRQRTNNAEGRLALACFEQAYESAIHAGGPCQLLLCQAHLLARFAQNDCKGIDKCVVTGPGHVLTVTYTPTIVHRL
jgi:hypothetical protein